MGYAVVVYLTACPYVVAKAVQDFSRELISAGTTAGYDDKMIEFREFNRLVGVPEIREREEKYYSELVHS